MPEDVVRAALEASAASSDLNRFLLAYGRAYTPRERPADVEPGVRHDSFGNAFRLARSRSDLRYCEGFSLPRGYTEQPNRHAWCIDADDGVIDPNPGWTEPGRPLRDCYFGIAIPLDFAAPYALGLGVLYELTGRMELLAGELGVEPV